MTGELFKKYVELGGGEDLGDPTGPEYVTGDGRYRDFHRGSIYWTPDTGACLVRGKILQEWKDKGAESSVLGYPTNDETRTQDGSKIYSTFQGGTIYYLPQRDACDVSIGGRDSQFTMRMLMRMAWRPCQAVGSYQQLPSRWMASMMRRVFASSPNATVEQH